MERDNYTRIIDRIIPKAGLQLRGFQHALVGPRDGNDYVHCDYNFGFGASLIFPIFDWLCANIFVNSLHCGILNHGKQLPNIKECLNNGRTSVGGSLVIPFPVGRYGKPFFSFFFCYYFVSQTVKIKIKK